MNTSKRQARKWRAFIKAFDKKLARESAGAYINGEWVPDAAVTAAVKQGPWPTPKSIVAADEYLRKVVDVTPIQTWIDTTTELHEFLEEYEIPEWYFGQYNEPKQEKKVKTARNAKPRPAKPTMTSQAQFKRDEELFPRLRIHRKHRAVVWFARRDGGVCVHAGAQDSPFLFAQAVDVGGLLKYGDFDDYVGTIVLSNT